MRITQLFILKKRQRYGLTFLMKIKNSQVNEKLMIRTCLR